MNIKRRDIHYTGFHKFKTSVSRFHERDAFNLPPLIAQVSPLYGSAQTQDAV